jgi:LmbE family N-acetylglucosaminyl deacetylase
VLSCGGTIARRPAAETTLVITVFAGDPDPGYLSPFAEQTHDLWGSPPIPYAVRRAEDRAAMQRLGAAFLHLGFPDAIYRRDVDGTPLYTDNETLFGHPHPADGPLLERLEAVLRALVCGCGTTLLYAPLTVGAHVDHQLVTAAARRLLSPQETAPALWHYEDFPYAAGHLPQHAPETLQAALARLGGEGWRSRDEEIDPDLKIEAIGCYESQIASLFGDEETMRETVREYAAALSTSQRYSERFWRPAAYSTSICQSTTCTSGQ